MQCAEATTLIDAYIDGELEPGAASGLEAHTQACQRCADAVTERRQLIDALADADRYAAPPLLRDSIAAVAGLSRPAHSRAPVWAWLSLAASVVLATATLWLAAHRGANAPLETALLHDAVSSHVRSLMAAHLADIATSDQHTVKPWFAGKLDFSPPVTDYASQGFPLTGGRLDYVGGRPVAAVVYARRAHVINLFVCPDAAAKPSPPEASNDRGFHAISWSDGAMRYSAVSDVAADELAAFVQLVRDRH
jgi:anti-sigma factor RsiW